MKPNIAVVGTGRMGSALARAFLAAGHATHVWNRTRSRAEPLASSGARVAATLLEAVDAADLVVVNVTDYAASDALLRAPEVTRALRGKPLVQLTSGLPSQARAQARWAQEHAVPYLDGAVLVTPNLVGTPKGAVLYAGATELFQQWQPALLALGANAAHVGDDVGRASALDSVLLTYFWAAMFGALQGAALCEAERVPLDAYAGYLNALTPVVEGSVRGLLERIRDGRLASDETTWATVATHHAGLGHLLDLCAEHGVRRAVPAAFHEILQAAVDAGRATDGFAVLSRFMR